MLKPYLTKIVIPPHAHQNAFPAKNRQFLAFNMPEKCEQCKKEEEIDDNKHEDKELKLVKDFLKQKNGLCKKSLCTDKLKNHVWKKKCFLPTNSFQAKITLPIVIQIIQKMGGM